MKEHLINAGAERLTDVLFHLQESCPSMKKQFEMIFQGFDPNPKKLNTMIRKELSALEKAKIIVRDQKVIALRDRLNQLRFSIVYDVNRTSISDAQAFLWEFLALDETTLDRLPSQQTMIFEVFEKAWKDLNVLYQKSPHEKIEDLVALVHDFIMRMAYDYPQLIFDFKEALGSEGLNLLESQLSAAANIKNIEKIKPKLQDIAACKKEVDLYIQVSQLITSPSTEDCLNIAEKLIEKWRGEEALEWVSKACVSAPHPLQKKGITLAIQALELNGEYIQAQQKRIHYFTETLEIWMYGEILKYAKVDQKEQFIKDAIEYAFNHVKPYTALEFLIEMRELKEAGRFICLYIDKIFLDQPILLKKWAQELIEVYPLASALIYRKAIDYDYGSYYDIARNLLEYEKIQPHVENWGLHENHEAYYTKIKNKYAKNYNFEWAYKYEKNRYDEKH